MRAVHPEGSPLRDNEFQDLIRSRTADSNRTPVIGFRSDDGRLRWVSLSSCPVGTPDAEVWSGCVVFLSCVRAPDDSSDDQGVHSVRGG